jgi:hypothetical protein
MQELEQLSRFDLVLAEFNLPDGNHLVPNLKKLRPELPVIVLSSDAYSARTALPKPMQCWASYLREQHW